MVTTIFIFGLCVGFMIGIIVAGIIEIESDLKLLTKKPKDKQLFKELRDRA